ncbi:hypothetical protein L1887_02013 [Cichorium endivia]|nr:hypothetical protein L1887_02013 [Cichorium endivia]
MKDTDEMDDKATATTSHTIIRLTSYLSISHCFYTSFYSDNSTFVAIWMLQHLVGQVSLFRSPFCNC